MSIIITISTEDCSTPGVASNAEDKAEVHYVIHECIKCYKTALVYCSFKLLL